MTHRALSTGVRLATLEAGEGGRPLLLVHGFTGAKEDFGDWVAPFADAGWWVVAPDLRGHGASDQPDEEHRYSLSILADDLLALAAELGWDRFALVGHSMGGMVAQDLVLRGEGPVERLVLMDTHHGPVEGLDRASVELAVGILRTEGLPALPGADREPPAEAEGALRRAPAPRARATRRSPTPRPTAARRRCTQPWASSWRSATTVWWSWRR
ncbi:MAG: alpha/beta fold hydrolase [Acidimicrobiales bacterium]